MNEWIDPTLTNSSVCCLFGVLFVVITIGSVCVCVLVDRKKWRKNSTQNNNTAEYCDDNKHIKTPQKGKHIKITTTNKE